MRSKALLSLILLCILSYSCTKDKETCTPAPSTLKEGLLLYMPFNGNLADSSGNSNNGTAFGTLTYSNNRYFEGGKALALNGADNRIEIQGQNLENLTQFTMYVEFMPTNADPMMLLSRTQFEVKANMKQAFSLMTNYNGAGTRFQMKKPGSCDNIDTYTAWGTEVRGEALPAIKAWNYLAITYDGTTIKSYLNGNLVGSGTELGASLCSGAPLIIGSWHVEQPLYFNGNVDELRVYNRVLSTDEITQIHQLHK
jgi:hypothetical protein